MREGLSLLPTSGYLPHPEVETDGGPNVETKQGNLG
jgi:hypothetical protein